MTLCALFYAKFYFYLYIPSLLWYLTKHNFSLTLNSWVSCTSNLGDQDQTWQMTVHYTCVSNFTWMGLLCLH